MRRETTLMTFLQRYLNGLLEPLGRAWVPLQLFSTAGIIALGVWVAGKAKGQQ